VTVEAKCVKKPVDRYDWVLDTQNTFLRIDIPNGRDKEDYKWSDTECDQSQNITFRLTVFRGSASSTAEKTVLVPSNLQVMQASEPLEFWMETRIELATSDNRARGRILIDGRVTASVVDGQPSSVRTLLTPGVHEMEAVVVRSPGEPGLWSFDFRGTQAFAASSVQVIQGNVVTIGQGMITFHLGGEPEEHLRLRFTLER
jgi:hypothetical protein